MGGQHEGAVALAHHQVREPGRATLRAGDSNGARAAAARRNGLLVLSLRWYVGCAHPQHYAVKIELVVHTPLTVAADTEAVTQAVQLPRPAPSPPVQDAHQVPGDRIIAESGRRDPVGGVQMPDRLAVPVPLSLRPGSCEVEVQRRDAVLAAEGVQVDRLALDALGSRRALPEFRTNGNTPDVDVGGPEVQP